MRMLPRHVGQRVHDDGRGQGLADGDESPRPVDDDGHDDHECQQRQAYHPRVTPWGAIRNSTPTWSACRRPGRPPPAASALPISSSPTVEQPVPRAGDDDASLARPFRRGQRGGAISLCRTLCGMAKRCPSLADVVPSPQWPAASRREMPWTMPASAARWFSSTRHQSLTYFSLL